ncbi:hypothetical protein COT48_02570 [Candidatus Woesearchaeota archaeon CG08_land_8_20_14_0_20_47_9]|nr:MAG: hypothetical protein COV22_03830 [Candidatus Woesearchaeota archaeon CG10_big_fil_rev_8_21_14_0_10_47_5]PIO04014.1 MAG: hypothetical protein COT48_02570 [Candidatus Woesearchaeota archaeon CG08_land_8_20_14_0_20_47_9]HII29956.1 hypothetical protein [Candidatus Woesearchaeota archaeon]
MVILKLMGLMDLFATIVMLLIHYNVLGWRLPLSLGMYLIFKGIGFWGDFASMVDLAAGIYMIAMIFGLRTFLVFVFVGFLFQKTLFSLTH